MGGGFWGRGVSGGGGGLFPSFLRSSSHDTTAAALALMEVPLLHGQWHGRFEPWASDGAACFLQLLTRAPLDEWIGMDSATALGRCLGFTSDLIDEYIGSCVSRNAAKRFLAPMFWCTQMAASATERWMLIKPNAGLCDSRLQRRWP